MMQYVYTFFKGIWSVLSLFFGFPYEQQAKKLKDYDGRGGENPKSTTTHYRANKVSKEET